MKKVVLFLFSLSIFFSVSGQLSVGIESGAVFTRMKYENGWSNNDHPDDIHLGYFCSGAVQFLSKYGFGFRSTFGYLQSGGSGQTYYQSGGLYPAPMRVNVNFLSFSLTARQQFSVFKNTDMYIGVGPRIDVFHSYKDDEFGFISYYDQMGAIGSNLFGLKAEAGVLSRFGRMELGLGASLNTSSTDLLEGSGDEIFLNYVCVGFNLAYSLTEPKNAEGAD